MLYKPNKVISKIKYNLIPSNTNNLPPTHKEVTKLTAGVKIIKLTNTTDKTKKRLNLMNLNTPTHALK